MRSSRRRLRAAPSGRRLAAAAVAGVVGLGPAALVAAAAPPFSSAPASVTAVGASPVAGAQTAAPVIEAGVVPPVGGAAGAAGAADTALASEPSGGIPAAVLSAYRAAEARLAATDPACGLRWPLLAGIGRIESGHARGGRLDAAGDTLGAILGPVLAGGPGVAAIADTDDGRLDGDRVWDRAVGPMQFIPSTWRSYAADGGRDGAASPHNVVDSTLAAARYLCAGGEDLRTAAGATAALFRYNRSAAYGRAVLGYARWYASGVLVTPGKPAAPVFAAGPAPTAVAITAPGPTPVPAAPAAPLPDAPAPGPEAEPPPPAIAERTAEPSAPPEPGTPGVPAPRPLPGTEPGPPPSPAPTTTGDASAPPPTDTGQASPVPALEGASPPAATPTAAPGSAADPGPSTGPREDAEDETDVEVPPDELAGAVRRDAVAYLSTTGPGGQAQVLVTPAVRGGLLLVPGPDPAVVRAVAADPAVALVWPRADAGGHALVVHGIGEIRGDGLIVRPTGAVLHRPAPPAAPAG